jgi:hypothetical protein
MIAAASITPQQIRRLQVLYKQYEAHTLDVGAKREDRLAWASERCGRVIASFSGLTLEEARRLIDTLQGILGVRLPSKVPRRRKDRRAAQNAGTMGRHDQVNEEDVLVGDTEIRRIQREMDRLGWTQTRLDAFLASPSGPNARRATIRTLADANRVYWALKRMRPPSRSEPGYDRHSNAS